MSPMKLMWERGGGGGEVVGGGGGGGGGSHMRLGLYLQL
jgi:hypothetical protein